MNAASFSAFASHLGLYVLRDYGMQLRLGLDWGLWLVFGLIAGAVHFVALRWNASLFVTTTLGRALTIQLLRLTLTALLLAFAAGHGALPLLLSAIGVFLARAIVLRVTAVAP